MMEFGMGLCASWIGILIWRSRKAKEAVTIAGLQQENTDLTKMLADQAEEIARMIEWQEMGQSALQASSIRERCLEAAFRAVMIESGCTETQVDEALFNVAKASEM